MSHRDSRKRGFCQAEKAKGTKASTSLESQGLKNLSVLVSPSCDSTNSKLWVLYVSLPGDSNRLLKAHLQSLAKAKASPLDVFGEQPQAWLQLQKGIQRR